MKLEHLIETPVIHKGGKQSNFSGIDNLDAASTRKAQKRQKITVPACSADGGKMSNSWKDVTCKRCLVAKNRKPKGGYRLGASPLWSQS